MQGSESVSGAARDRDLVNGVGKGALTGKREEDGREEPLVQTGVGARMGRVLVSGRGGVRALMQGLEVRVRSADCVSVTSDAWGVFQGATLNHVQVGKEIGRRRCSGE